jgi:hypothetical protein
VDEKSRTHVIKDLIRPSGGLYYHLRAWRHGRSWQPFREQLAKWLDSWNCPHKELILLGPSAGYSLPDSWLRNFSSIQAFDLDPLAGPLFRLRHPDVPIEFHRANLFWQDGRLSTAPLQKVLDAHPQAPVLFCNVLGQVLLEGHASEEEWTAFLRRLRELLNSRSWASYHDVQTQEGSTAVDHMTDGDWCSDLPVQKFEWQMSPSSRHFLAGIRA